MSDVNFKKQLVDEVIGNFVSDLVNSDNLVTSCIAETNALDYSLDGYEILNANYNNKTDAIDFSAHIMLKGDHDEEKPFCGSQIEISLDGCFVYSNGECVIEKYQIDNCEITDF